MKYLGIDYGSKKIGIAISDDNGKVAFARNILKNDSSSISAIASMIENEKVKTVVFGESLDFKGNENDIMKSMRVFSEKLKQASGAEIKFFPEYLSSSEAGRIIDDKNDDARAAAIVLQAYLDTTNNKI